MTSDELLSLLESRRSVRRFRSEVPGKELLQKLIAAAITAPSASNKQPWRFSIVTDRARITAMADAVRTATERIAEHVEPDCVEAFRSYGSYFLRFEEAPAVIVPLCRRLTLLSNLVCAGLPSEDLGRIDALEQDSGLIGTSLALQNLLLMAHALGLGASGMTGPLVALDALRDILQVKPSWKIVALVPVGFPDEDPKPTTRKSAEKVIRWLES